MPWWVWVLIGAYLAFWTGVVLWVPDRISEWLLRWYGR